MPARAWCTELISQSTGSRQAYATLADSLTDLTGLSDRHFGCDHARLLLLPLGSRLTAEAPLALLTSETKSILLAIRTMPALRAEGDGLRHSSSALARLREGARSDGGAP